MSTLYTLKKQGHVIHHLDLSPQWRELGESEDYDLLYSLALHELKNSSPLGTFLQQKLKELKLGEGNWELMLAKRVGPQDEDEEGIWHDDGSRHLAFSLSLNDAPHKIEGGVLHLREKKENLPSGIEIPTQSYGTLILFATGQWGWEHKISRVTIGNRLVLVGWYTLAPEV